MGPLNRHAFFSVTVFRALWLLAVMAISLARPTAVDEMSLPREHAARPAFHPVRIRPIQPTAGPRPTPTPSPDVGAIAARLQAQRRQAAKHQSRIASLHDDLWLHGV